MIAPTWTKSVFSATLAAVITEEKYLTFAQRELSWLIEALDASGPEDLEAELESDILTLEFSDGTKYVINSHRAARQIWMAAERSAWHFDWDPGRQAWISDKAGEELWAAVNRVIGNKLPQAPKLTRPSE